jgi:hypothetical protein
MITIGTLLAIAATAAVALEAPGAAGVLGLAYWVLLHGI